MILKWFKLVQSGFGAYVPRSVDWYPCIKCITSTVSYGAKVAIQMDRRTLTPVTSRPVVPSHCIILRGLVETFHSTSRCSRAVRRAIPAIAGGGTAQLWRLHGDMVARRLQVPIQVRSKSRKAFEIGRDMRGTLLVNRRRSARRTGEVDEKSGALRLPAPTHRGMASGKHPL